MEMVFVRDIYRDIFANNGLMDFYKIYNYHSDKYFSKNPLRDVVSFKLDDNMFFLKRHKERYRFWNRCNSNAREEWDNIDLLNRAGFETMEPVAYGEKITDGIMLSFIISKKIEDAISLEEYVLSRYKDEGHCVKNLLIKDLASLAKRFHSMGFCHQDFYTGHIFLKNTTDGRKLFLIDVQRLLVKRHLRDRWRIKDIAQLNYSCRDVVSNKDRIRFLRYYFDIERIDRRARWFVRKVQKKTKKISRHTERLIKKGAFNFTPLHSVPM